MSYSCGVPDPYPRRPRRGTSPSRGPFHHLLVTLLAAWYQLHHLIRESVKFATVGSFGFVVDVAVFNALLYAGGQGPLYDRPLTAKTIAVVVATVITYTGNRHWTFRHRARTGITREYPLFFVLNGVGLGIALTCLAVSRYVLGFSGPLADNLAANVIGLGLGTLFRFWSYRKWVFPAPHSQVKPVAQPADA